MTHFWMADAHQARRDWGLTPGPAALAFAVGATLPIIRVALGDDRRKRFEELRVVLSAAELLGWEPESRYRSRTELFEAGVPTVARIQLAYKGWIRDRPKWLRRRMTWVACGVDAHGERWVYHLLSHRLEFGEWRKFVPRMLVGYGVHVTDWAPESIWRLRR